MIEFDKVSFVVADGKSEKKIINEISFKLPDKGLFALYGESGCGKTTTLNLILNKITKTSGDIKVAGYDYDNINNEQITYIRRNIVSCVEQSSELFDNLTLLNNLKVVANIKNCELDNEKLTKYLSMLKLDDLINEKVYNLSGGEKQRVSILRAFMFDSKIILLDEPTASLDKENSTIVLDFIKELSKEKLVVISSHDRDLINCYTKKHIIMKYGEIIEQNIEAKPNEFVSANPILKPANSLNNYKVIYKSLFGNEIKRRILSSLMYLGTVIIFLISLTISNTNLTKLEASYFNKSNQDYAIYHFDWLNSNDFHFSDNINTTKMYLFECKENNDTFLKYLYIDNTIKDDEIELADFSYNILKSNDSIITENEFEYMKIDNTTLKINKVLPTNYQKFENSESLTKTEKDVCFYKGYVNYKTMVKLDSRRKNYKDLNINGAYIMVYKYSEWILTNLKEVEEPSLNQLYMPSYIKEILMSTNSKGNNLVISDIEYEVKLFDENIGPIIVCNDNAYDNITEKACVMSEYTVISRENDFYNVLKELKEVNASLVNVYKDDLKNSLNSMKNIIHVFKFVELISGALVVLSAINYVVLFYFHNKKKTGIILTNGGYKQMTIKSFLYEIMAVLVGGIALSFIGLFVVKTQLTRILFSSFSSANNIYIVNNWSTLVGCLLVGGVTILVSLVYVYILKKIDIKKLLNE